MIYEFQISTATTDTPTAPKETLLKLCQGVIHQIQIVTFTGVNGVLFLRIMHGGHQIFPINYGSYFRLCGEPFNFIERYNLREEPFNLVAYSYLYNAGGVSYDHDCIIRFGILKRDELTGVTILWDESQEEYIKTREQGL